ncbi:unnamed protein product [Darwinula stevensoni]|uniref:Uncharacterized protein n=1 Tax=Darwinula stevensoni TaxID=69355 RepID=A0A7R8ZXP7_9CRUS|nr:unnamed protein product [Darwinula stevensoni]CAG0878881.1 unnamed protein product [Darwinula stevensoni]
MASSLPGDERRGFPSLLVLFAILLAACIAWVDGECQCGVFILWEENRRGEEVFAGEAFPTDDCSRNSTSKTQCRDYCLERSRTVARGGNMRIIGPFLSLATKLYTCKMIESHHHDQHGDHFHLEQPQVSYVWTGGFYRWCGRDWRYVGTESTQQICCTRQFFASCPANMIAPAPPPFQDVDPEDEEKKQARIGEESGIHRHSSERESGQTDAGMAEYVDFGLGFLNQILRTSGMPTVDSFLGFFGVGPRDFMKTVGSMEKLFKRAKHEFELGSCYMEFFAFDIFRNRHEYGFTLGRKRRKRRDADDHSNGQHENNDGNGDLFGRKQAEDIFHVVAEAFRGGKGEDMRKSGRKEQMNPDPGLFDVIAETFSDVDKIRDIYDSVQSLGLNPFQLAWDMFRPLTGDTSTTSGVVGDLLQVLFKTYVKSQLSSLMELKPTTAVFRPATVVQNGTEGPSNVLFVKAMEALKTLLFSLFGVVPEGRQRIQWDLNSDKILRGRLGEVRRGQRQGQKRQGGVVEGVGDFVRTIMNVDDPTHGFYCLKSYFVDKLYNYMGKGLQLLLF